MSAKKSAEHSAASVMPPPYPGEYPKIVVPPPGPKSKAWNVRDKAVVSQNLTPDYELVTERASGMVVEDLDGNRYLDFAAGISTVSTGHCHPAVVKAVQEQAERMLHICYTDFHYPAYIELCEMLAELAPMSGKKRVFLSNSGAEAVETSIKLARIRTGRSKIIAFYGAFHGRTLGTVTLTASKPVQRLSCGPLLPDVFHTHYSYCYRCPVNRKPDSCDVQCLELLTDSMFHHTVPPQEVAAVLVEPIQGEGGFIPPHAEFLPRLQALCREHGILLIADEVQCGMGRTGKLFASEHYGIDPDIFILAKGIASGMPISAVIARDEVMKWNNGSHGSTFGGNPLSCQAALATLRLLRGGLIENAGKVGAGLLKKLRGLMERHPLLGDVRGLGLMIGLEIVRNRDTRAPAPAERERIVRRAFERGLLTLPCGKSTIRLSPPLVCTDSDADKAVSILDEVLTEIEAAG
ncbi:MAG: acetyl ornithine aminotransferase family protein [Myxococcales bacterium]|nr:acetyl ornithine aminotransferase family protein [Myxococcales bacterium]MDH5306691.1 acetyl ornithine aminotransferase family protein [Myxococcales bacterium]MDH5565551.1 acetyl ornithine aminotransferase family protein [Myxococcales bacterium]